MPTLDEYLGGIFASLTQARMIADAQTVSAAETYAKHELLRHFAVPHLRFSDIELTIPVAIDSVQPACGEGISAADREALRHGILGGLVRPLAVRQFSRAAANALNALIDAALDRLAERSARRPIEECLGEFAQDLAREIGKILKNIGIEVPQFDQEAVAAAIREVAKVHIKPTGPPAGVGSLQVIAETHRLRELRPSDVIVVKMKVCEEGMEWQQMEMRDGRTERKLLPE